MFLLKVANSDEASPSIDWHYRFDHPSNDAIDLL